MIYASAVADGVHNLMTMESSPADVRARRIIAKLAGVPALLAAAASNLARPAAGDGRARRRACSAAPRHAPRRPAAGLRRLEDPDAEGRRWWRRPAAAATPSTRFAQARDGAPAQGDRRLRGRPANVEARYRAEELIDLPAPSCWRSASASWRKAQAAFIATAAA